EKEPEKDPKEPKDDRTEIRGTWITWTTVARSTDRETFPPEQVKVTYVITDDKLMRVGDDGFLDREQTFKLDPTQRPKAIDITDRAAGTRSGIYQLEDDTLKIYSDVEGKRPTAFPGKGDPMQPMLLKRVSRAFAPVAQRFANAPGCFWMINPTSPPGIG